MISLVQSRYQSKEKLGSGLLHGGESPLPCLSSNNSTEIQDLSSNKLSSQGKKSAISLAWNVQNLVEKHGIERIGFLTLTFSDHVLCAREAQRRFNSLLTHIITPRYKNWVRVLERTKSGRIHYHLLVVLQDDIRTGFNFSDIKKRNYKSANPAIRAEWTFWRKTAPKYGFGRTELLPIKSNIEAMSRYVGKYISKHLSSREQNDKGIRLVAYSRGAQFSTTKFSLVNEGSKNWRHKCDMFVLYLQDLYKHKINIKKIEKLYGKRWCYKKRGFILAFPDFSGNSPDHDYKIWLDERQNNPPKYLNLSTGELLTGNPLFSVDCLVSPQREWHKDNLSSR
jgi:hypothetical protein